MDVPKTQTRPFEIVFTKKQFAQGVRSRSTLLVCVKGFLNVFVTNQEGLGTFLFGLVPRLTRIDGLQTQQKLRGRLGRILIIR